MCDQVLLYQQMVRPHPTDHLDDGGICFADLLFPLLMIGYQLNGYQLNGYHLNGNQ